MTEFIETEQEKTFTLSEIKKAFWDNFHKSGEQFFSYYQDTEERNNQDTEDSWESFSNLLRLAENERD